MRDPRKDPKLNDRFLTPKGNVIVIVGLGTENYRVFATLRKYRANSNLQLPSDKRRKGGPKGHHAVPGTQIWWDDLLAVLQQYTPVTAASIDLSA